MTRRTRRWIVASTLTLPALITSGGRLRANSGMAVPLWGSPSSPQAGPLGMNLAADPGQVPVEIRIPDAGVDAGIERLQIVDGQMLDPTGPWVVAWYEQTARVGALGNCVMAGHLDYWDVGAAVFHDLAGVSEGALIDVTGKDGATYTYAVTNIRRWDTTQLTDKELESPEMVGHTDYAALTLVTCGGNFNGQEYTERDLVRGELISVQRS